MKKQIQTHDMELFREAVADTQPVHHEVVDSPRRRPPPVPRPAAPEPVADPPDPNVREHSVLPHDYLLFARPGVQRRLLSELQRGGIEVGLEIDLHGLRTEHAQQLLADFLLECAHRRVRCARVIHGKGRRSPTGQAILKQKVDYWLRLRPDVLAFCSATQRDGGNGAVYVLLRNPNKATRGR